MGGRLDRALGNVVYLLETTTPTSTIVRNRWESYDPLQIDCPLNSAGIRKFYVEWISSDQDVGATDLIAREAWHIARLHIEYPTVKGWNLTQELVALDRHDLRKLLRDQSGWVTGWTSANGVQTASDETGIQNREFNGDEIVRTARDKWTYIAQLNFQLRELES
jgi:hypothetical protein